MPTKTRTPGLPRRGFLQRGLAAPAATLLGGSTATAASAAAPCSPGGLIAEDSISMRQYLSREARRITANALGGFTTAAAWKRGIPERRRQFLEMMGLDELPFENPRPAPKATVTGVIERERYRIEKLHFESLPDLHVTANLYVPKGLTAPAPGILYVCGHARKQKVHYQAHARRFAELGFVCLLIETVASWENEGHHHGQWQQGWFHWFSRGYTAAGIETLNGMRALDLLVARPDVVPGKLGVTGNSGGGTSTWWLAAADERVTACAPCCGTSTIASYVQDRLVDDNCDCMWWINSYLWDLADVGALIAPRPLLIADADQDIHFTRSSMLTVAGQLERHYRRLGAAGNFARVEGHGGHGYHPNTRRAIFSWFVKHLQGKNVPPEEIGDLDERPEVQESDETLKVYVNGPPPGNRVQTIQDSFLKVAEPPAIGTAADLERARTDVIGRLRKKSFNHFPKPPALQVAIEHAFRVGDTSGAVFRFTSEEGWRLRGLVHIPDSVPQPAPAIVALRSPREPFGQYEWRAAETDRYLRRIRRPWARVAVELRGTGDGVWGDALEWHLRRAAAWAGRTLASMWVWDTLRALECVRQLPQTKGRPVALAGRGEMAAVALYAALLDGRVDAVILEDTPATQNAASPKNGHGNALEMLGCLRVTDLWQVAGLLFPAELVVAGECPATYDWAEALYRRLGRPERFRRVDRIENWRA